MKIESDVGLANLIEAITGARKYRPMICRVCNKPIEKRVENGYLCLDCYRAKNSERARWRYLQDPSYYKKYSKEYIKKHPERARAMVAANLEYKNRQVCMVGSCNELGVRHHPDYNKPREIVWLCPLHHKQWHRGELDKLW